MLRRPHERASNIIPQLPKQPEMADTRLRYRRIPPEARSGSLGSLGNHFPPRFQFPHRTSLLESLTSDDEASSFAIRKRRSKKTAGKKRHRKSHAFQRPSFSSEDGDEVFADLGVDFVDEETTGYHHHHNLDLLAAMRSDEHHPVISPVVPHISLATVAYDPTASTTPTSTSPTTPTPPSPVDSDELVQNVAVHVETKAVRKVSRRKPPRGDEALLARKASDKARQAADVKLHNMNSAHSPTRDSRMRSRRKLKSEDSATANRSAPISRPTGITESYDGRRIAAPASMDPRKRANFVLMAEQPIRYFSRTRGKKRADGKPPLPPREGTEVPEVEQEVGVVRDKELSVSFAQRRYTAEEAAVAKPLNALQRLWHAIAILKVGGGRRGKR